MLTHDRVLGRKLTPMEKQRLRLTVEYLKKHKSTRDQVADLLRVNERTARECINAVGFVYPVAIERDDCGRTTFFISRMVDHEPHNLHKIMDRLSRCEELLYSILPNLAWEKAVGVDWSELEGAINKFLGVLTAPKIAQMLIKEEL